MSRAFVKEDAATEEVVDRPISPHPNYVTLRLGSLKSNARSKQRARLMVPLKAAATASGLQKAQVNSGIGAFVAAPLNTSLLTRGTKAIQFGMAVTILRDGREQTFQIVGEDEADPSDGKISYVSPLARVLMNREVGDSVMFRDCEIEIVAVHPA